MGGLRGIKRMESPLLVPKKTFVRCCSDGVPHCESCGIKINPRIGIVWGHVISPGLGGEPMLDEPGGTLTAILPVTARNDRGLFTGHRSPASRLFQRERDQHQHYRSYGAQPRVRLMEHEIPHLALSVRRPWAWALFYAGKDLKNRDWRPTNPGLKQRGSIAIHASKGMTKAYYQEAAA